MDKLIHDLEEKEVYLERLRPLGGEKNRAEYAYVFRTANDLREQMNLALESHPSPVEEIARWAIR